MNQPNGWARYVRDITAAAPQRDVATRAGIEASVLSRWLSGRARPRAEQAIKLARAYKRPPTEALIAAGYLQPEEAGIDAAALRPAEAFSNDELVNDIERLWLQRQRLVVEMVSRFLGRPVEIEGPMPRKARARRKLDVEHLGGLSDVDLLDATAELMAQRTLLMDEIAHRLLERGK